MVFALDCWKSSIILDESEFFLKISRFIITNLVRSVNCKSVDLTVEVHGKPFYVSFISKNTNNLMSEVWVEQKQVKELYNFLLMGAQPDPNPNYCGCLVWCQTWKYLKIQNVHFLYPSLAIIRQWTWLTDSTYPP